MENWDPDLFKLKLIGKFNETFTDLKRIDTEIEQLVKENQLYIQL